jgi:hypothetical protein
MEIELADKQPKASARQEPQATQRPAVVHNLPVLELIFQSKYFRFMVSIGMSSQYGVASLACGSGSSRC